jgi:hypothetical protein
MRIPCQYFTQVTKTTWYTVALYTWCTAGVVAANSLLMPFTVRLPGQRHTCYSDVWTHLMVGVHLMMAATALTNRLDFFLLVTMFHSSHPLLTHCYSFYLARSGESLSWAGGWFSLDGHLSKYSPRLTLLNLTDRNQLYACILKSVLYLTCSSVTNLTCIFEYVFCMLHQVGEYNWMTLMRWVK